MRVVQGLVAVGFLCLAVFVAQCARGAEAEGPFACRVVRVIDGDTLVCDVGLGLGVWLHGERVRVRGIDCPELPTAAGSNALAAASAMAPEIRYLVAWGRDSFGRILGSLMREDGEDMGERLLSLGLAREYHR